MTYALMQTTMEAPPIEALRKAFLSSHALSAADAMFVADDAYGILARDLDGDDAQNVAASLAAEGVHVELVAEGDLPRLPEPALFVGFQFYPQFLRLLNAREEPTDVPYRGIRLVAVGYDRQAVRLEIVFGDATLRYHANLEHLHFHHEPSMQGKSPGQNLVLLVRQLHQRVPGAIFNRGAHNLTDGAAVEHVEDFISYPRTSAFFEEMVWLLWKARRGDVPIAS
ncbi:MAG: hypothetical protein WCR07_04495 [Verrucomicrobiota bacterium]